MPTEDFIKPGFVTPQMAAALQTGFGASMAANDELMNRARDMPEEFLPVKLTAVDGSKLYSWTLQYKDTTNLRVDHPNGRTGTPTNNPAYDPNSLVAVVPCQGWIKRFGWDSTKGGVTYEVIGATGTAAWIRFTLGSTLTTSDATQTGVTVDDFWGGGDPGATVTISNLPASSNYIFSGASGNKGLATWDSKNAKWWIVQLECP